MQEIEDEASVVRRILRVCDSHEQVEGTARSMSIDALDRSDAFHATIPLTEHTCSMGFHPILRSFKGREITRLCGCRGAEPSSQEALKAVPNGRKPSIRIVECEVAKLPTGGEIDLGDAIQRDHGHLLGTACDRHPLPCEVETIIDLVRYDDEIRMV